jgi:glutathione synthase/RimK-type ligase-like ATP-grasp enzyme
MTPNGADRTSGPPPTAGAGGVGAASSAVALATSEAFPDLYEDDRRLLEPLRARGLDPRPTVWSAPGVRWEAFELVVVRSTWDYHRRLGEFLTWVDRVATQSRLCNAANTIRWNSHKSYLRDLERAGVPIVPTVLGTEVDSVTEALRERGWETGILKPAVSANAEGARLLRAREKDRNEELFQEARRRGEVLVQPYLPAVDDPGERSLVYLDGTYSHGVVRVPRLSPEPRLRDGTPVEPTAAERNVARRALETVTPPPLYARVDVVEGPSGAPCVMELELIEPLLYLGSSPTSAAAFAEAIRRRLL